MSRRLYLVGLCLVVGLALAARLVPQARTIDDAYITFRYARHLVAGEGFVFNPGERVLGTTTPFYTFLLAALARLGGYADYPRLAWGLNALADALTCVLLARLARRLTGRGSAGVLLGGLWAIAPMSVTFAIGGMETSVFILWLVLSANLYLAGHSRWAAAVSALLVLTRPDGLLWVALLGLDVVRRSLKERRWPWPEAAIFAGLLAPWLIFATLYFGSPLPHSIAAKALVYHLRGLDMLVRWIQHYGTPFMEQRLLGVGWILPGFCLYLLLSAVGGMAAFRRQRSAWLVAAYPWFYWLAFVIARPLVFRWYLAPPLPFYFLSIWLGLGQIVAEVSRRLPASARWARRLAALPLALAAALFVVGSLAEWTLRPDHGPAAPAPDMAWHKLELLYEQVGRDLARSADAQTVIAAGDVGALGYYSQARILDTVGLMSPEALAYYPLPDEAYVIGYAVPARLILERQPTEVVLLEVYARQTLCRDPAFLAQYALIKKIPTDIYGSDGLLIWRRR